jgi:hypothetical protein
MRFVGKNENGKKCSSDGSESRLLAKIKMAFTERSRAVAEMRFWDEARELSVWQPAEWESPKPLQTTVE